MRSLFLLFVFGWLFDLHLECRFRFSFGLLKDFLFDRRGIVLFLGLKGFLFLLVSFLFLDFINFLFGSSFGQTRTGIVVVFLFFVVFGRVAFLLYVECTFFVFLVFAFLLGDGHRLWFFLVFRYEIGVLLDVLLQFGIDLLQVLLS